MLNARLLTLLIQCTIHRPLSGENTELLSYVSQHSGVLSMYMGVCVSAMHLKSITSPKMWHASQNTTTATNHRQAEILTATKFGPSPEAKHALSRPTGSFSNTPCAPWLAKNYIVCAVNQQSVN